MELGLFNLMSFRDTNQPQKEIYRNVLEQVQLAEQVGFGTALFAEHHFTNYCMCPSPLVMMAHCASGTSKIKLAPGVLVLPLYEPVRLLGELAMVDQMTNGRVMIGLGSGYQNFEFERFRKTLSEGPEMFMEMLDIIEMAYAGDVIEYQGKHYQIPETPLCVRPVNDTPEVFVAGLARAENVQMRMAKSGYIPLVGAGPRGTPVLKEMRQSIDGYYTQAGLDPANALFGYQNYVHVTDSKQDALDAADQYRWVGRIVASMRGKYQQVDGTILREIPADGEPRLEDIVNNTCIGSPEQVAEKLVDQIKSLNPMHMTCFMQPGAMEQKKALRSIERLATEVMPMVEKEVGPLADIGVKARDAA